MVDLRQLGVGKATVIQKCVQCAFCQLRPTRTTREQRDARTNKGDEDTPRRCFADALRDLGQQRKLIDQSKFPEQSSARSDAVRGDCVLGSPSEQARAAHIGSEAPREDFVVAAFDIAEPGN